MKFFIKTFGCQMNENDSLLIGTILRNQGYTACAAPEEADIIIVNTCCVRQNAENRALGFLGSIKKLKEINPDLVIAVCGCMIQKNGVDELLRKKYRHIGIITGTFSAALLPKYILEYKSSGKTIVNVEERYDLPALEAPDREPDSYRAQVNINFGCNNFCTYCIVPYVRGRERSRDPQSILKEIHCLVDKGVKEIQLLGQNVNSYGNDKPESGWDFPRLLQEAAAIDGLERIRFMTSHPRDFSRKLVETIAANDNICRHIHLPVQSGSDRLLKLMNRGYTSAQYLEKLSWVRETMPDAAVTSDMIVGFPGETEDDMARTLEFLQKAEFDAAYTFIYSKREGTKAAEMPGHLDEETKKERLQRLMAVQDPISLSINKRLEGTVLSVMTEGASKNSADTLSGRTCGNKIVIFPYCKNINPGDTVSVKIKEAKTWNLVGELE